MPFNQPNFFKKFPFAKIVVALIIGIVCEWYFKPHIILTVLLTSAVIIITIIFSFLNDAVKFKWRFLQGSCFLLLFGCLGALLTWNENVENSSSWYDKNYNDSDIVMATLQEPLVEKPNSYKALATIAAVYKDHQWTSTKGNVLIYFKRDQSVPALQYGSQIIFNKKLQSIQNSGNPAALNYKRFCLFQNITGQIFLSSNDYKILAATNKNVIQEFLFYMRDGALKIMQQNIRSPKELGIAEALLIGYRNDLDKDLVQAYSDTGVVHIIAISGMHIAIIYQSLLWFFGLFKSTRFKKIIEPISILIIIWAFTLIAGAAPSIARASVMFTCILAGKFLNRSGNIYNTLAASAFILLVSNPFNLWDVGFQLSYAAVLSIVVFFKPLYSLIYVQNKSLQKLWQLSAVTLSAQVFALPLVIYHFHQLPLVFLVGNLIAVPLSGFILYAELLLFAVSWWHAGAAFIGLAIQYGIRFMNVFIEYIDKASFAVWDGLSISLWQLLLLFACIISAGIWLMYKNKNAFIASTGFIAAFMLLWSIKSIQHTQQQKIVVYNVPQHSAIDFISGNNFYFGGDSIVIKDVLMRNFNLKPNRIKNHLPLHENILLPTANNLALNYKNKKVLLLNQSINTKNSEQKIHADIIIITGKIKNSITDLQKVFDCDTYIVTSVISSWKCMQWKKDCEQLHLRFHSVAQQGAAVINL